MEQICLACIKIKMVCSSNLEPRQPFPPETVTFANAYYIYKGICYIQDSSPSRGSLRNFSPRSLADLHM